MDLTMSPAFPIYAICCAVLVIKMMAVGHYTGIARYLKRSFVNPEDSEAFLDGEGCTPQEHPDVERTLRIHRNDIENILPFFLVGWIYLQVDSSVHMAQNLFVTFTLTRVAFTIAYLKGYQPWRSLLFIAGEVCTLIMVVEILIWAMRA